MSSFSAQMSAFVTSAMDAIEFKMIREAKDWEDTESFHPEMAHQIFGDEENIFGYKDLQVQLYYAAGSLDVFYKVYYSKKIDDLKLDDMKSDSIDGRIEELLPEGVVYTNKDEFAAVLDKKNAEFRPMGEKLMSFELNQGSPGSARYFDVYTCTMDTPNFLKYHAKFETFLFWFIDGASRIIHDTQWTYFLVFERYTNSKGAECYAAAGYSSIYQYFSYPEKVRPRISQMFVLPPFQRIGLGTKMIEAIYRFYGERDDVNDITVEEPSPIFQHMRSIVDVKLCRNLAEFAPEKLKAGISTEMIDVARKKFKITPKQCRIVYEILRLAATDRKNDEEYAAYRLMIKKRLNMQHHKQKRDLKKAEKRGVNIVAAMMMLPTDEERLEQLQAEFKATEEVYMSILKKADEVHM